jgi:D-glycero-alpha-D-manno-heptose-7-phosphate kinase
VYNRVVKQFNLGPLSFKLTSYIEAPQGSGLGTSSTIVVSLLGAFVEWLKLPLGKYDIAHLAYDIERIDLSMSGGKQDQYAATFGGINFLEFSANDKVIVNPLQLKSKVVNELELSLLLYFTSTQRLSAGIINEQVKNVQEKNNKSIEAMHNLKEQAHQMKDALLREELNKFGEILHFGWQNKKQMAQSISNPLIDKIYETAMANGATVVVALCFFIVPEQAKTKWPKLLKDWAAIARPLSLRSRV